MVSSCSTVCDYNLPRSYHLAELPQALIVCHERTRQLLGSTKCGLISLLVELSRLRTLPPQPTSPPHEPKPYAQFHSVCEPHHASLPPQNMFCVPNGAFICPSFHLSYLSIPLPSLPASLLLSSSLSPSPSAMSNKVPAETSPAVCSCNQRPCTSTA